MNEEPNPADVLAWQERREALRAKAQGLLDLRQTGHKLDFVAVHWAEQIVAAIPPMKRADDKPAGAA